MNILENINGHGDLACLNEKQRIQLCAEIRDFLISKISKTGGHLASNLGVVELTVAIETVFNTSEDRLVFDVGHQSYVHKMLTGRQADFDSLRQYGGIAGFPKPSESQTDAFVAGHASSSVSIALGMARARTLSKQDYHVIAVIGDGAATGGMAYEGLNDAAVSNEPMIIILNDNEMSIDHNVGGMALHLSRLRTKEKYLGMKEKYRKLLPKIPGGTLILRLTRGVKNRLRRMLIPTTIFESMGLAYLGPVDGHDTEYLISLLQNAKEMDRPVLIHILTHKGHGYAPAEQDPSRFHGISKFDPVSGDVNSKSSETFSDIFGKTMLSLAQEEAKLCAITAAMPGGTGLLTFKEKCPERLFDVGIAEEHAVSMAGGLSKQGMIPVVAIYSTFLQRSYDMILQDIAMQGLHVVFAIDRAGLVGEDGETHHGVFDVGFLRHAPGMMILSPASCAELRDMLRWAVKSYDGPVAIRYPRGGDRKYSDSAWKDGTIAVNKHNSGDDVTIISYGTILDNVMDAAERLSQLGINATVLRLMTISPLPIEQIVPNISVSKRVVIVEETCSGCGIGDALVSGIVYAMQDCRTYQINLGDHFVTHGSIESLYRHTGLDAESIAKFVQEVIKDEKQKTS